MKVWVCQCSKGTWPVRRPPKGAHPVVLTRLVFKEVSSMNASLSSRLRMKG